MKILILTIVLLVPTCLKAQEYAKLGTSRENVRSILNQLNNKMIKISESRDSDMLIGGNGTMTTIIYYKNNISNRISVTFHWISKEMLEQKFLENSFKKINDNELINSKKNVRIVFITDKKQNTVTMIETPIDK